VITYYTGLGIERTTSLRKSKQFYLVGIIANVLALVFFKYANFFTSTGFSLINLTRQKLFHTDQVFSNTLVTNIIVPLGISYITFQAIGYLIELKRGTIPVEKNLGHFSTYLLFFPKITAGPIERGYHFLPQFKEPKKFQYANMSQGLKLILTGLFKKLVIADRVSIYVAAIFENAEHHSSISLIVASIFYVFQMYADFSGYTDMARGFARILGFDLLENFNLPLLSKSVTEFWRRWHITLSTWFRDYFYTPITIAKRNWGKWGIVFGIFVTFTVLGFWHGPNWTFIVFGALQGVILSIEFFTSKARKRLRKKIPSWINSFVGIIFTVSYFGFSLIFFRAPSVDNALLIIKRIFTAKGPLFMESDPSSVIYSVMGIFLLLAVELKLEFYKGSFSFFNNRNWLVRNLSYAIIVIIILLFGVLDGGQFIYFQF
jgi:D-alanyl-lipoteichoic acid acyltransferase DltB (MBOAT superfamily)